MEPRPTLELVRNLCRQLETEGISYCHWKSNAMLDRSASGENDLDLLVGRTDAQRFTRLLYQLGFKEAQTVPGWQQPGIVHFYGYDAHSDKLVHVHAHYQLILGHDLLKNYRLSIETSFLECAVQNGPFKVPIPEMEFIVFVIRMVLKRPLCDLRRHRSLSDSANQELQYLQSQTCQERIPAMFSMYFPDVKLQLFNDCVNSLQPDCSRWARIRTGWRLRRALRTCCRYSWLVAVTLKTWRRFTGALRIRLAKLSSRKRLVYGGMLIAIVGGDGAGKSTAVQQVFHWLAKDFDVMPVHMGKPPRSWLTFIVDGVIRFCRLLDILFEGKRSPQHSASSGLRPGFDFLHALRCVCTARDRYKAYRKIRRFTSNGGIAICDRYPLPQVKRMDGPRLGHLEEKAKFSPRLTRFLAQMEEGYYRRILPPDLLIVLRVPPNMAVQRKVEENAESVRTRSQEIWELDWPQTYAYVVDASHPQAKVLSELKSLIWSKL